MKSDSSSQIWHNEFLYLSSYTYQFIYKFRIYTFEFMFMTAYTHKLISSFHIWIHLDSKIHKMISIFICIWIHTYENIYMNSYELWIHMIFSYVNSYVSWIHLVQMFQMTHLDSCVSWIHMVQMFQMTHQRSLRLKLRFYEYWHLLCSRLGTVSKVFITISWVPTWRLQLRWSHTGIVTWARAWVPRSGESPATTVVRWVRVTPGSRKLSGAGPLSAPGPLPPRRSGGGSCGGTGGRAGQANLNVTWSASGYALSLTITTSQRHSCSESLSIESWCLGGRPGHGIVSTVWPPATVTEPRRPRTQPCRRLLRSQCRHRVRLA